MAEELFSSKEEFPNGEVVPYEFVDMWQLIGDFLEDVEKIKEAVENEGKGG